MPLCVAAEDPRPLGELGPLPLPPPPGRDVAPLAPFAPPPPGPRDPAATASFTFAKASDPRVAYPVASTPAPTAASPTPMPTPTRSPPLIEATPPSIAEEILGAIPQSNKAQGFSCRPTQHRRCISPHTQRSTAIPRTREKSHLHQSRGSFRPSPQRTESL